MKTTRLLTVLAAIAAGLLVLPTQAAALDASKVAFAALITALSTVSGTATFDSLTNGTLLGSGLFGRSPGALAYTASGPEYINSYGNGLCLLVK